MEELEQHAVQVTAGPAQLCHVCASSTCGVGTEYLNYKKLAMVRLLYQFHMSYHMRCILKQQQVTLPGQSGFNIINNPYSHEEFLKVCQDYDVPNDSVRYQNEGFYQMYQHSMACPDDYQGPNSMASWMIETSQGLTDMGLFRISESIRDYMYLILISQANVKSRTIGHTESALIAQKILFESN